MRGRITYSRVGQRRFFIDAREVTEAEFTGAFPPKPLGVPFAVSPTCWPMVSDALAVHPKQIAAAEARNKRHGVNVVYEPKSGRAILPDRNERRKLLRLETFHDNDAGYGD